MTDAIQYDNNSIEYRNSKEHRAKESSIWEDEFDMLIECADEIRQYQSEHLDHTYRMGNDLVLEMAVSLKAYEDESSWYDITESIKNIIEEENNEV